MSTVVAVILARERRMVARFRAAGAVSREQARTLEDLGIARGVILRRLRERAVIREAAPERFYLDQESWNAVRRSRRRAIHVASAILLAVLLAILFGTRRARAQAPSADWLEIDAIFSEFTAPGSPGCAVGLFQNGTIRYARGYGLASVEHAVPITPDSVFYAGSVSKQFTAFAAAAAIQDGVLSADDPIRKWLPELPPYADGITVRHLVHHTSGLRDYNTLLSIAGRRGDEAFDNPTVLRMTARQKELNFEPGTEYLYSNTGYTLLATIVERATKTPFAEFADRKLFAPLGMKVTHFHTDSGRLVTGRALAYTGGQSALRLDTPVNERAGAGGLYTNIPDLLKWDENFYTAAVGGGALVEQVQTAARLKDGKPITYAWGLQIGAYRGQRIVEHSGSLGGYRAHTLRFPEQHTSFVALCNLASANAGGRLRRVADIVLKDRFASPPAPARPTANTRPAPKGQDGALSALTSKALEMLAGTYESAEIDAVFTVRVKGTEVMLQRDTDDAPARMQRGDADTFRVDGFSVRFERSGGRVTALVVDAGRVRNIRFARK